MPTLPCAGGIEMSPKFRMSYALQGWRKHKVYPDFIFALTHQSGSQRIWMLETKGDHLDNPDTAYKKKLFEICSGPLNYRT